MKYKGSLLIFYLRESSLTTEMGMIFLVNKITRISKVSF